jgi:hypothetical protein
VEVPCLASAYNIRSYPHCASDWGLIIVEHKCAHTVLLQSQDEEREAMVLSERMAEEGDVDGSMAKMAEVEALQRR